MEHTKIRAFLAKNDSITLPYEEWEEARQVVLDYGERVFGQGALALFIKTSEPREHFLMWGKPVILEEES